MYTANTTRIHTDVTAMMRGLRSREWTAGSTDQTLFLEATKSDEGATTVL